MIFLLVYFTEEVPTIMVITLRRFFLLGNFLPFNWTRIKLISLAFLINDDGA